MEAVKVAVETIEKKNRPEEKTTQLVKPRFPPLWSGQEYDRWRVDVEKWFNNDKYIYLLESLKKNEVIKDFVVKTLVEKVGETRMVKRILEVMTEKFTKTTSEKIVDMIRKISDNGFILDEKIYVMIDRFEEMKASTEKIRLPENLK